MPSTLCPPHHSPVSAPLLTALTLFLTASSIPASATDAPAVSAAPSSTSSAPSSTSSATRTATSPTPTATTPSDTSSTLVYFGTYTGPKSRGIYVSRLDLHTGALSTPQLAAETTNPSFLTLDPDRRFLIAANEIGNFRGTKSGALSSFSVDPLTGHLSPLNQAPSGGSGPCFVALAPDARHVLTANYGGGSIAVVPVSPDGRLAEPSSVMQHHGSGADPKRQSAPHAHSVNLDPTGRFALAADLGLEKILVYRFDSSRGNLAPHDPPATITAPGSGPRHLSFHPNGRFAYVTNEMPSSVSAYAWNAERGVLTHLQTTTTLPASFPGDNSTAEVKVHPSGRFLYVSNRGHDSLAHFRIDTQTGHLTPAGHTPTGGQVPRGFIIHPSGRYLIAANQKSDNLVVFRVDEETGSLEPAGPAHSLGSPVCVTFLP